MNTTLTDTGSPFHEGERIIQERNGKRERMEYFGKRAVRPFMPEQHRDFFRQLPFIVVGSVDDQGLPWASMVFGETGFIQSPTDTSLSLSGKATQGDPLKESLGQTGRPLGLLGIELMSRRRNRVNVRTGEIEDGVIHVNVDQSFGNCPQYIQVRHYDYVRGADEASPNPKVEPFVGLTEEASLLIDNTDTFFVSSFTQVTDRPDIEGVDVSHRGGMPGFIKREGNTLTIPDYPGNNFFNTLGNFLLNPQAGLLVPDFTTGDVFMLSGDVDILWEDHPDAVSFRGAERAWRFTVTKGIWLRDAMPFRSRLESYSPNTEMTGTWKEVKDMAEAQARRNKWQSYRIEKVEQESRVIRSFYLKPIDGSALLPFKAGQHLSVKVSLETGDVVRNYTLSNAPNENYYRLSIKREELGSMSTYFHDTLVEGSVIQAKAPKGNFFIDPSEQRPAVLIAGGVGITPMMSMAQHIVNEGRRTRYTRSLAVFHASQSIKERAFFLPLQRLQKETKGQVRYYSVVSKPEENTKAGEDYHGVGHINADMFRQVLPLDDHDFYLCGPNGFMQAMYDALLSLGVQDNRIYAETFGPSSLLRKTVSADLSRGAISTDSLVEKESDNAVIKFTESAFEQNWNAGDKTLLEIAEDHGLTPNFSCRSGSCGSCAAGLISGEVTYRTKPTAEVAEGEVLICCAVPAKGTQTIEIEL